MLRLHRRSANSCSGKFLRKKAIMSSIVRPLVIFSGVSIQRLLYLPLLRVQQVKIAENELKERGRIVSRFKNIFGCGSYIYYNEGTLSFWKASTTYLLEAFTSLLVGRPLTNFTKILTISLLGYVEKHIPSTATAFIPNSIGLIVGSLISYPFAYLTTKINLNVSSRGNFEYRNSWALVKETYQSRGIRGYYRGFVYYLLSDLTNTLSALAWLWFIKRYLPPVQSGGML